MLEVTMKSANHEPYTKIRFLATKSDKIILACKRGVIFFTLFQTSGGKHETRAGRESRATGAAFEP